jgi:hypothetical protein
MAEFALVAPVLLFVLLTVGDFARYFATSIALESMARTAAEVGAQEYVHELAGGGSIDYALVHQTAWQSVCDEGRDLPNAQPGAPGAQCGAIPTLVCVHDAIDGTCPSTYNSSGAVPASCGQMQAGAAPTTALDSQGHKYVEVRVCYRFSTFFGSIFLPFLGGALNPLSGDFYIERTREFTVADY